MISNYTYSYKLLRSGSNSVVNCSFIYSVAGSLSFSCVLLLVYALIIN